MKITSSTLGMDATTVYREVNTSEGKMAIKGSPARAEPFRLDLPGYGVAALRFSAGRERSGVQAVSSVAGAGETRAHSWSGNEVVSRMGLEASGRQVDTEKPALVSQPSPENTKADGDLTGVGNETVSASGPRLSLTGRQVLYREEQLRVNSTGTVETDDGRRISLDLELELERQEISGQIRAIGSVSSRFVDPLVLSFDDGLAVLADSSFSFDLDGDGDSEEIATLKGGSGYLALDKNGDGKVNDGSELFGPATGFGYDELTVFDEDGNNWIDENDPVFDQLQLWMGGGSDGGKLVNLRQAGVGALSLASTDAHFNLKNRDGRITGQVHRTGLFLTEDGEVRPLAEIDLALQEKTPPEQWREFSQELQEALRSLREMIADRRRRVASLATLHYRLEKEERREAWLLDRLLELQEDKPSFTG